MIDDSEKYFYLNIKHNRTNIKNKKIFECVMNKCAEECINIIIDFEKSTKLLGSK